MNCPYCSEILPDEDRLAHHIFVEHTRQCGEAIRKGLLRVMPGDEPVDGVKPGVV
jgi:hypothetical protein